MKTPRYASSRRLGINMTPMIDVVFLLIIFFLVSSHLARQETQIELPLPIAQSGMDAPENETPRVTLNVLEDGKVLMAGREIAPEQLLPRLQQLREDEGTALEVRIRSSRMTPYSFVEPIMNDCTQAGIWNVSFSVYRKERRP